MKTEQTELLVNCGREMAESLMESAVTNAESADQMTNQIFILRSAAISILAHEAYNQATQMGISFAEYMASLTKDIRTETSMLADSPDMELLKTK
jgi:hypothetical protein